MSADASVVMFNLETLAAELDRRSNELADTERSLEPAERAYDEWIEDFTADLWDQHQDSDSRFPGEQVRMALARRAMPRKLRDEHAVLMAKRRRIEKRIGSLKTQVSAQQSILSALKLEAEASGSSLRSAA